MRPPRSKEAKALQRQYDTRRQTVIRTFDLDKQEVARLHTMDVHDPLSDYVGNMAVHAELIAADRHEVPSNIILGEE